jgi:tetratricopeptide (TPR) repeat protein
LVRYLLPLVAGALSLLAKPMLVTLPFLLLLLDVWPLRRFTGDWPVLRRVILEKVPLLIMALLVSWIAVIAEDSHGALAADIREPLGVRLLNIPVVYLHYLGMAAWPVNLVPFYPYFPGQWSSGQQCVALVGLAGIVGMLLFLSRRQPGLLVGLLWFAGTLFPVVGLVPVGSHLLADRYLYFPIIGLILMLAALIDRIVHPELRTSWLIVPLPLLVLLACGMTTHRQLHHWQDSSQLWTHTLRVSPGNWVGHNNYAIWLREQGQDEAALRHLRESARINPAQPRTYLNLGVTCDRLGRSAEAEGYFLTVLQFDPDQPDALTAMGAIRKQQGRLTEARELLARAIEKAPGKVCAHDHLGDVLWREGRRREALAAYQVVLQLQADAIEPMNKAGLVLLELGRPAEALDLFTRAIQHESKQAVLQANAGAACFNLGRLEDAVRWFREALKLDPWYASAHLKLAQTLIRLGRLSEAADHQSQAIALNPDFAGVLPPARSLPSHLLRPEPGSPRTAGSESVPGSPPATPPVGNPQPAWVGPR